VIGGGDWGEDRLVPDCIRAVLKGEKIVIRRPTSIRPWQHVLEPLYGYLMLAERLYHDGVEFAQAWNFGPFDHDAKTVEWVVKKFCEEYGNAQGYVIEKIPLPHETHYLKLDCSKAVTALGWMPKWDVETAIQKVIQWTKHYQEGGDVRDICYQQINDHTASSDFQRSNHT
jgi:CDP-glucose 4,6-dehydratase